MPADNIEAIEVQGSPNKKERLFEVRRHFVVFCLHFFNNDNDNDNDNNNVHLFKATCVSAIINLL